MVLRRTLKDLNFSECIYVLLNYYVYHPCIYTMRMRAYLDEFDDCKEGQENEHQIGKNRQTDRRIATK